MRQADLAAAAIIRVMTSETTARERPTMAVTLLMREGYAVLLPPNPRSATGDNPSSNHHGVLRQPDNIAGTDPSSDLLGRSRRRGARRDPRA